MLVFQKTAHAAAQGSCFIALLTSAHREVHARDTEGAALRYPFCP
jgi:hypothetical protein